MVVCSWWPGPAGQWPLAWSDVRPTRFLSSNTNVMFESCSFELNAVLAFALLLAFLVAMTWVGMYLGLIIGNQETAAQVGILVFPVAMVSNIFVPTSQMVSWLRVVAEWNPLSALATAVRELFGNPTGPTNGAWPLEHPALASLLWMVALLLIFVPLCTARYARADR